QAGGPRDLRETQPPGPGPYVTANACLRPLPGYGRRFEGPLTGNQVVLAMRAVPDAARIALGSTK
ncbi:MAG TPA: hypothetical protein PLQ54_03725, partial [Armatimonadota bacterium]|nr:hypothetical protein [Armatimonadota bacterium]